MKSGRKKSPFTKTHQFVADNTPMWMQFKAPSEPLQKGAKRVLAKTKAISIVREVLLKGKAQYSWPPSTNLDQLLFILKILFTFFTKQATLVSLPSQLVFPGLVFTSFCNKNRRPNEIEGAWDIILLHLQFLPYRNKLECLPLSDTSTLV